MASCLYTYSVPQHHVPPNLYIYKLPELHASTPPFRHAYSAPPELQATFSPHFHAFISTCLRCRSSASYPCVSMLRHPPRPSSAPEFYTSMLFHMHACSMPPIPHICTPVGHLHSSIYPSMSIHLQCAFSTSYIHIYKPSPRFPTSRALRPCITTTVAHRRLQNSVPPCLHIAKLTVCPSATRLLQLHIAASTARLHSSTPPTLCFSSWFHCYAAMAWMIVKRSTLRSKLDTLATLFKWPHFNTQILTFRKVR